jgi:hypothetical protein
MSGLTHILGDRLCRAAVVPSSFGALFAASLVLWCAHGSALADSGVASVALEAAERDNRRAQDKKAGGSSARKVAAREAEAARDRARAAIRAESWALAERLIRGGLKTGKKTERDAWHLVDSELAFARKRYARSGLIAMRIVILRPKSGQVGAALYRAARAYEGLDRPDKAAELHRACIEHKTTRSALRKKAEKRLKKLTERRPKP